MALSLQERLGSALIERPKMSLELLVFGLRCARGVGLCFGRKCRWAEVEKDGLGWKAGGESRRGLRLVAVGGS